MVNVGGMRRWHGWPAEVLVLLVAVAVLIPPVLFGKLHDDEVIYYEIARNVAHGLGPVSEASPTAPGIFTWHIPFPSYLAALPLYLWDSILTARATAALFSAIGTLALFRVGRRLFGPSVAWTTMLLAVTSFYLLRFGGRFYYDPFGFGFFWLAVDAYVHERHARAGFWIGWAVLSRELYVGPAAVLCLFSLLRTRRTAVLWGGAFPAAALLLWVGAVVGPGHFLDGFSLFRGSRETVAVAGGTGPGLLPGIAKGWAELLAALGLATPGLALAGAYGRRQVDVALWTCLGVSAAIVSVTPGFFTNGGFTQYPLLLLGFAALIGAVGLQAASRRWFPTWADRGRVALVAGLLTAQVLVGNSLISRRAAFGSMGVYGLGIESDDQIIALLRERAAGKTIAGIHGAFVPGARWFWVERRVAEAARLHPEWVVVYRNWVEVDPVGAELWSIGPYYVIHLPEPERFGAIVHPRQILPGWR